MALDGLAESNHLRPTIFAMNEKIKEEIQKRSKDNRLPCAVARAIARDLSVPIKEIGRIADELKIKITNCELGCF